MKMTGGAFSNIVIRTSSGITHSHRVVERSITYMTVEWNPLRLTLRTIVQVVQVGVGVLRVLLVLL
jgi:hypothetical protein